MVPREHRAIRSGTLACQAPAALAARAGHPPLVANLSGFTSANFAFPAMQVFVHPPETDGLISGGLLRNGRWANGKNEATRRKIVGTIARALSASPGSSFVDLGANIEAELPARSLLAVARGHVERDDLCFLGTTSVFHLANLWTPTLEQKL